MKKIITIILICSVLFLGTEAQARHHHSHGHSGYHRSGYYHSGGSSSAAYIINKDYKTTEQHFPNCDKHYAVTETIVYYYSDGTRRVYNNSTLYKKDGTIIQQNCLSVNHLVYDKKHYFIVRQSGYGFKVIDENGEAVTKRPYSRMEEIVPNRLLVKYNKKLGIIDLKDNAIVPLKYQKFSRVEEKIFISKLNGYYGVLNSDGKILIPNEYDKIALLNDSLLLKKYHKYGLSDTFGKIILEPEYDKIKKLGEYIIVRKGKRRMALDSDGTALSGMSYKKIRLERNKLQGLTIENNWQPVSLSD